MKKSKEITDKNLEIFTSINKMEENLETFTIQVSEYYKKIKKEFSKILLEEKCALLIKISEGENIDIDVLKSKYLKSKDIISLNENNDKYNEINSEELLDRIEYNGKVYYYENKEKGKVFDSNYNEVGLFKNKSIILS
jgi:YHS domain-containing protein